MDSTSGTSRATKTCYTVWMSTTRKKAGSIQHTASSQSRQVEGGSRRCVYTPTHSHTHAQIQMSNASDSISFVYARSHAHFEWSDEATLCWRMFFLRLLNRHTSVFTEWQSRVGGKEKERQTGGGREEWKVGMKWRRLRVKEKKETEVQKTDGERKKGGARWRHSWRCLLGKKKKTQQKRTQDTLYAIDYYWNIGKQEWTAMLAGPWDCTRAHMDSANSKSFCLISNLAYWHANSC